MKAWQRRWFVLQEAYFSNCPHPGSKTSTSIPVCDIAEVSVAPEAKRPFAFKLVIPNVRTYFICAESQSDCSSWIDALTAAISPHRLHLTSSLRTLSKSKFGVRLDAFEICKLIGRGQFGKVNLVRYKKNGQYYAMKMMSKHALEERGRVSQAVTERNVLCENRHPFLISAHWTFQTTDRTFMVMDYLKGGELFERLQEERKFSQQRTQLYAAEIVLALEYLHSKQLIYRDLKAENVMIDEQGHLKLRDFGLVKSGMGPTSTTTTFCGTIEYMAPEVLKREPYTRAVDWWALGQLIFEMLTGLPAFYSENQNAMCRMILNDDIIFPDEMSPIEIDLILKLLDKNPKTRLGGGENDAQDVKKHPYFKELDWERVCRKEYEAGWIPDESGEMESTQEIPVLVNEEGQPVEPATQEQFQGFTFTDTSLL
jgi:serine/threonine protein kinase